MIESYFMTSFRSGLPNIQIFRIFRYSLPDAESPLLRISNSVLQRGL